MGDVERRSSRNSYYYHGRIFGGKLLDLVFGLVVMGGVFVNMPGTLAPEVGGTVARLRGGGS